MFTRENLAVLADLVTILGILTLFWEGVRLRK